MPHLYQKALTHNTLGEQRKKMLEWLCPAALDPTRDYESAVSLCQPGTGTWFTEGDEFQEWRLKKSSMLWLYGIRRSIIDISVPASGLTYFQAGAGKTILMWVKLRLKTF